MYRTLLKNNTTLHVYEFDPNTERIEPDFGILGKREVLSKLGKPRPDEEIACITNWPFKGGPDEFYGKLQIGDKVYRPTSPTYPSLTLDANNKLVDGEVNPCKWQISYSYSLVLNGRKDIRNTGYFPHFRSGDSRTAIGQKADGKIMVVVFQDYYTADMQAEFMLEIGCVNAWNGDGGGSSEMIVEGKIVNKPTDGSERPEGYGLVVYRKRKARLIAIDDGHGMETAGKRTPMIPGTNAFMHENEFNNAVAQLLKMNLERCGFNTLMVAEGDTDVPLKIRTDKADAAGADLYISVHANALTGIWGPQNGISTYHYPSSVQGKKAAEIIHKHLLQGTKLKDRGVLTENFHVLRETNMPSVLAECAFMDNLTEAKLLLNGAYRQECADEIAKGICEYFGVAWVPEIAIPKTPTASDLVEILSSANPKVVNDKAFWLKRALTDKDIFNLMVNMTNYIKVKG